MTKRFLSGSIISQMFHRLFVDDHALFVDTAIFRTSRFLNLAGTKSFCMLSIFRRNPERYHGVRPIQVYLLQLLYALMFLFLPYETLEHILTHTGQWQNADAAAWCMWFAYPLISVIGIFRPFKMLPVILFEIIYKITWLLVVAYPLWRTHTLAGSPAEEMTKVFIVVIYPVIVMPWGYFIRNYITGTKSNFHKKINAS